MEGTQHHMHAAEIQDVLVQNNEDQADELEEDDDSVSISFTNAQTSDDHIMTNRNSILLDIGSNCSVFNNRDLLAGIYKSTHTLRAYTNVGHQESNMCEMLPGFFEVWYNPDSMMNILALSDVTRKLRITMDTATECCIDVYFHHKNDHKVLKFKEMEHGLFLLQNSTISV